MELIPLIAQILLLGALILFFVVVITYLFSRNKKDINYYENKSVDPPASLMIKQSRSRKYVESIPPYSKPQRKTPQPRQNYFPSYRTEPLPEPKITHGITERDSQYKTPEKRLTYTTGGTPRYIIVNEQMREKQFEFLDERLNPPYSRVSSF
ncbi:MAG: hypothetical protein PHW27_03785 [Melioribacteraceae bacterium]|nr:hypothetical protein [Melioribacteraceae bacterium]MDD3557672.1 hypothetical protein [Melioribacteraceae bacterium]